MHSPRFEEASYYLNVDENISINTVITQLKAVDEDEGVNGTVNYRLISGNDNFNVDETTGELSLKHPIDSQRSTKHLLIVEACDSPKNVNERRSSRVTVVIEVQDANNHSPLFVSVSETTLLIDSSTTTTPFHYFIATDADMGVAGKVSYSIVNGNRPAMFSLDSETGKLIDNT